MSQTGLLFFIKSPHPSLPIIKVITAHFRKLENTEGKKRENKKALVILASEAVAIDIAAFLPSVSGWGHFGYEVCGLPFLTK